MEAGKKQNIPEAPQTMSRSGNLLSSVAPPTELPSFVTSVSMPKSSDEPLDGNHGSSNDNPNEINKGTSENFSPAIPLSVGEPIASVRLSEDAQETQNDSPISKPDVDSLGDIMPGSGLLSWVRGAVTSGGLLQRVAEKARSSVDTMITTLDPQMKDYLNSGGDVHLIVASDREDEISPIREAFQSVFGKATVVGYESQRCVGCAQAVGAAAAYAGAKQRVAHVRSEHSAITNNEPILAVHSFLHELVPDRWFELDLLVLCHAALGIEVVAQAQGAALPAAAVAAAREATPPDYPHAHSGHAVSIASIMAASLQVAEREWQEHAAGVSRRATLALAARSLAANYRRMLAASEDRL